MGDFGRYIGKADCGDIPMVILLVDDDRIAAQSVALALNDAGHGVLGPVGSVDAAMGLMAELPDEMRPDLALLDVRTGGTDEGAVLAREFERRWSVPSLFVNGHREMAYAARNAALGLSRP